MKHTCARCWRLGVVLVRGIRYCPKHADMVLDDLRDNEDPDYDFGERDDEVDDDAD